MAHESPRIDFRSDRDSIRSQKLLGALLPRQARHASRLRNAAAGRLGKPSFEDVGKLCRASEREIRCVIAGNLAAIKIEIAALMASSRIVSEVNRLIGS